MQPLAPPSIKLAPFVFDGSGALSLYTHQTELLRRILDRLTQGMRVRGQMATGSGKTETALGLIEEWLSRYPRALAHFIAHRRELVHQHDQTSGVRQE